VSITSELLAAYPQPEADRCDPRYATITDHWPVEVEVCDLLYGIVRALKPARILELGTNIGFSAAAMALGLRDNARGWDGNDSAGGLLITIDTVDFSAREWWAKLSDMSRFIKFLRKSSLEYEPQAPFNLIFIDTLKELLFRELERYHRWTAHPGWMMVHDSTIMPEKRAAIDKWLQSHRHWRNLTVGTARGVDILFIST
jgi:predicted O-methyltransferase YrrM